VDVVGSNYVVEYAKAEALPGFEKPPQLVSSVSCKLEKKSLLVAAMGDVPDLTRQEMTIGARHRFSLKACIPNSKTGF
jgi:hypothetical protein